MPTADGKPVVIVIANSPGWAEFRQVLGNQVMICTSTSDPYDADNIAQRLGGPDIIAIGCISNGSDISHGNMYTRFIQKMREPTPKGSGFTGPIIGLCDLCVQKHLDAGCDEVVQFGAEAAERILELLHPVPIEP